MWGGTAGLNGVIDCIEYKSHYHCCCYTNYYQIYVIMALALATWSAISTQFGNVLPRRGKFMPLGAFLAIIDARNRWKSVEKRTLGHVQCGTYRARERSFWNSNETFVWYKRYLNESNIWIRHWFYWSLLLWYSFKWWHRECSWVFNEIEFNLCAWYADNQATEIQLSARRAVNWFQRNLWQSSNCIIDENSVTVYVFPIIGESARCHVLFMALGTS